MSTNNTTWVKKNGDKGSVVLYISNHIIYQRYFNIRDYNENSVNSFRYEGINECYNWVCTMWYFW
jgi:hypothetical protein